KPRYEQPAPLKIDGRLGWHFCRRQDRQARRWGRLLGFRSRLEARRFLLDRRRISRQGGCFRLRLAGRRRRHARLTASELSTLKWELQITRFPIDLAVLPEKEPTDA